MLVKGKTELKRTFDTGKSEESKIYIKKMSPQQLYCGI